MYIANRGNIARLHVSFARSGSGSSVYGANDWSTGYACDARFVVAEVFLELNGIVDHGECIGSVLLSNIDELRSSGWCLVLEPRVILGLSFGGELGTARARRVLVGEVAGVDITAFLSTDEIVQRRVSADGWVALDGLHQAGSPD